jgi:hypothetical protein
MISEEVLRHVLPGHAVYFVLRETLSRDSFLVALDVLQSRGAKTEAKATPDDHWNALEERRAGKSRWDSVMPPPSSPLAGVDALKWMQTGSQSVQNILRVRPFTGFAIEGIRYTIDWFNPNNELEMPYRHAGEPVIALLFQGADPPALGPGRVRDRLAENRSFYEILKDLDGILRPQRVCGTYSLMSVLCAYREGRADPALRPWDFLFPLHVLQNPPIPLTMETRFYGGSIGMMKDRYWTLAKVKEWSEGRVLIQVRRGIDQDVAPEYFAVAKALGMIPVQQLVEGAALSG